MILIRRERAEEEGQVQCTIQCTGREEEQRNRANANSQVRYYTPRLALSSV